MTGRLYTFAAAIASAAFLVSPAILAQSTKIAKPSPYQGVSQPPSAPILDDEDQAPPTPVLTQRPQTAAPSPVTTAPPAEAATETHTRKPMVNPGSEIVTYIPGPANALPEGTVFRVYMTTDLMASDSTPGTVFRGKLVKQLMYDGRVVVPAGSELVGHVSYATYGRRMTGRSLIHLVPQAFILPDGTHYALHAEVIDTAGSNTKATGEGDITSSGHAKRALIEMGAGTGGGAVAGAFLAGPMGAAVGSLVGAGAMGAHWLLAEQAVEIPKNSTVVFSLTSPMPLTPAPADQAAGQPVAQNGD